MVAAVRQEVWPIKIRKLAARDDSKCLDCKLIRGRPEGQVMVHLLEVKCHLLSQWLQWILGGER